MDKYGVNTQRFKVATTVDQAFQAAQSMQVPELVLKAQIHAGGRGKGVFTGSHLQGGVQVTRDCEQVRVWAEQMLGNRLITKQTPAEGVLVNKVMIAEALDIERETYFAIVMDRASGGPVMVGSPRGGVDIEAVAEQTPELMFRSPIDIQTGPTWEQTQKLASQLGFTGDKLDVATQQMLNLYKLFIAFDATQVEINPFGETPCGRVVCFDAKINFDDNAEFRQLAVFNDRDTAEEDPREVAARKFNLNYIGMDGSIGCLVNGAGLAMATMDIIQLHGGSPANFLDVGGSATESQVKEAFKIITSDTQVKAILVNIFGGIMKCDTIASGIVAAMRDCKIELPLVVRLSGTNVERGIKILKESGLPIISATDLDDAAMKAVAAI